MLKPGKREIILCLVYFQIDEVKEELQTIVNYLKDPQKYTGMGATMPRGKLFNRESF